MNQFVINCTNVTKRYDSISVVNDVSFELQPGEILSVLGPSGCGKTTLLRLIAGLEIPNCGTISIDGKLMSSTSINTPTEHRSTGMVFQEYALFPNKTVIQNIGFGLNKLHKTNRRQRIVEMVNLFELTDLENHYPHELSGGQQQRVAIARTLAPQPIIMLLDEPFSNLDFQMRRDMRQEMTRILRKSGTTTIFVTHDQEEAFAIADRVAIMKNGRFHQIDKPDVIYNSPSSSFVAKITRTCDFLIGKINGDVVTSEIGVFNYTTSESNIKNNSDVELLIHPNDFEVTRDERGKCVVESTEFRGDHTILTISTPSGSTIRCKNQSDRNFAPKTQITLTNKNPHPFVAFQIPITNQ